MPSARSTSRSARRTTIRSGASTSIATSSPALSPARWRVSTGSVTWCLEEKHGGDSDSAPSQGTSPGSSTASERSRLSGFASSSSAKRSARSPKISIGPMQQGPDWVPNASGIATPGGEAPSSNDRAMLHPGLTFGADGVLLVTAGDRLLCRRRHRRVQLGSIAAQAWLPPPEGTERQPLPRNPDVVDEKLANVVDGDKELIVVGVRRSRHWSGLRPGSGSCRGTRRIGHTRRRRRPSNGRRIASPRRRRPSRRVRTHV